MAGIALAILGMTGERAWKQEDIRVLQPGESATIAGYSYRLDSMVGRRCRAQLFGNPGAIHCQPWMASRSPCSIRRSASIPCAETTTTQAAIRMLELADLYGVIGEPDGKGGWTVRFYYEPLVPLIWIGCLIMALGGIVSLSDRRYRVGAP